MSARRYELDAVAFHEAGHAVACLVLNVTLKKKKAVSVVPKGDELGRVRHHRDWCREKGRSLSTVTLCGPVAEDLYLGLFDGTCSLSDVEDFRNYSCEVLRDGLTSTVHQHPRYSALVQAEMTVAKILMLEHWEAVRLIAAALLLKKTLDRDEVEKLYWSTLQPEQANLPLNGAVAA
jgi:ATP-dependent Zn protease